MTPRKLPVVLPLALVATLAGCVERGGWKSAPRLEPRSLTASQALAGAKIDAAAWPAEGWWRGLGDPQLDALVDEALAGSPSLEVAQARLRDRKSTRLNSSHTVISYAVFCLKKKRY